jgi:uncharacterized membrane protein (DUF106 family)
MSGKHWMTETIKAILLEYAEAYCAIRGKGTRKSLQRLKKKSMKLVTRQESLSLHIWPR